MASIGEVFTSYRDGDFKVISIEGQKVCVEFITTGGLRFTSKNKLYHNVNLKDYFRPSVCGVGYLGCDTRKIKYNPNYKRIYRSWVNMLKRVYENHTYYENVSVCKEWLCFKTFYDWAEPIYEKGFHLDKDINQQSLNKEYNPVNCKYVAAYENSQKVNNRNDTIYIFKDTESDIILKTHNPSELAIQLGFNRSSFSKLVSGIRKKCKHIIYIGDEKCQ